MEKIEYEELCRREGELEQSRSTIHRQLVNLKRVDPAILDYDARKKELENDLNVVSQEKTMIRAKLDQAKPLLDIATSRSRAKAIPKVLISLSLDQQPKELDDELSYEHCYRPCNHIVKQTIFDLIPASNPAAWNALIDQYAIFDGQINCPTCMSEKKKLTAKIMERINELRRKMPEATIADQSDRNKIISSARFNVHIKR